MWGVVMLRMSVTMSLRMMAASLVGTSPKITVRVERAQFQVASQTVSPASGRSDGSFWRMRVASWPARLSRMRAAGVCWLGGGMSHLELYWKMSRFEADVTLGVLSLTFLPVGGQEEEDERLSLPQRI